MVQSEQSNGLMVQMERRAPSKHHVDVFQRARREFESPLTHKQEEWMMLD